MLLENEKNTIIGKIEALGVDKIKAYASDLKESKEYTSFETRISFDVLHAIDTGDYTNYLYGTYNCNDNHIETLLKYGLKKLGIL
jgi:hypothetical protein